MLILLLSSAVSFGWLKNENKHGSIWIQNDHELKALSLAVAGGGGGRGGGEGVIPLYNPSNRYLYNYIPDARPRTPPTASRRKENAEEFVF